MSDIHHWFTEAEVEDRFGFRARALEHHDLVFSVPGEDDDRLYPAYQFDSEQGQPWPVINSLCLQFETAGLSDWLPVWLEEPNAAFSGDPPAIHLAHSGRIVAAASRFLIEHKDHQQSAPFSQSEP